jgi:hypothetical protein
VRLQPAAARKLVEDAVAYAASLGLSAHSQYSRARQIFGSIDAADSDRQFEFGQDGKPFFISGPRDSPGRCQSILGILRERVGEGNFEYVVHLPGMPPAGLDEFEFVDEEAADDTADSYAEDSDVIEGTAVDLADPPHIRLLGPHSTGG